MAYTTSVAGTTITASWANANVRDQGVTPFATISARDSAITAPVNGMLCYVTSTGIFYGYNGAWLEFGGLAARTAYTPAWTSDGTLPTLGNGTLTGRYRLTGKELDLQILLQSGNTSTYGTSTYRLSLPASMTTVITPQVATAVYTHAGTDYPLIAMINGSASTFTFRQASANAVVSNLVPVTMASGDSINLSGRIEIA